MKTTTISRDKIEEGMIVLFGATPEANQFIVHAQFFVHEVIHNNDDSTLIRGNFRNFWDYPSESFTFYDYERVKIVVE